MPQLPLAQFRVVEIGPGDAVSYCGKLFSDFGAEVIKIEPPGGNPARLRAPLADIGNGQRESAYFAWLNTNKHSVTADLAVAADAQRIHVLLATADLLLDGRHPAEIPKSLLSHDSLRKTDPGLAITALSWFGEHGPHRDYLATDAICHALAGLVKLVGPAEGPPTLPRDGQPAIVGGLAAFIPSLAGLYGRKDGARRFAVSIHEAMLHISEFDTGLALEQGFTRPRPGVNRFGRGFPSGTFPTKHGWLGVTVVTPAQWSAFCQMLEMPELAKEPKYSAGIDRFLRATELNEIVAPALLRKTALEWFTMGIDLRLPLAVVPDMLELLAQETHSARGAFANVEIGDASFEGPVLPQTLTRTPPKPNGRAPLAGTSNGKTFSARKRDATRAVPPGASLPLKGVRIIDLTMGWAGPTATRQMADLGADVIKIESCQYPDWFRGTDTRPPYHEEKTYEKNYWFQMMNRNKRGITLDLTQQAGLSLLKRLMADADAVIDNYAADVLPRLGLDTQAILNINPRLVVVTMPAFGITGAWSNARAYGSTLEQASGLPSITGPETQPPTMLHAALGDPVGGLNGAASLMLGLMHQQTTGEGQHIDLSQVQCLLPFVAAAIVETTATGKPPRRTGNRHPEYVPHGCFPCLGDDQWIAIAVRSDDEWQKLCTVMRRPDLAADPDLRTAAGRRAHEERVELAVRQWTMIVRPDPAMVSLQAAGVPAGVAELPGDLASDPHLMATGHWQPVTRPFMGPHLIPSVAYREGDARTPYALRNTAPTVGQHNHEVLRELLKLDDSEIDALAKNGVIGNEAVAKSARKAE